MVPQREGDAGKQIADALVKLYGPWPGPMMAAVVADHYRGVGESFGIQLVDWIVKTYEPKAPGPPVLAQITRMASQMPPPPAPKQLEDEGYVGNQEGAERLHELLEGLNKHKTLQQQANDDLKRKEALGGMKR